MKKTTLLTSIFAAGALTLSSLGGTAEANEEEGAKTVWGEVLPADADPDGDGWANTGFDPTWMSQESQNKIAELGLQKDYGNLTQVEYNEEVAALWEKEEQMLKESESEKGVQEVNDYKSYDSETDLNKEKLAHLALNSPEKLNAAPIKDELYDFSFAYDGYQFHFAYDGVYWEWSYENTDRYFTDDELIYLVHNNPEKLNETPVMEGAYDFKLYDDEYVYHFASDGEQWTWQYEAK